MKHFVLVCAVCALYCAAPGAGAQQYEHPYSITTIAGVSPQRGASLRDGPGDQALFNQPVGIVVDQNNRVFVADLGNQAIRAISPDGNVSTFAGRAGSPGSEDGATNIARFNNPYGLKLSSSGILYVADSGNHKIRFIETNGLVGTMQTSPAANPFRSGGQESLYPVGVAFEPDGELFAASDLVLYSAERLSTYWRVTSRLADGTLIGDVVSDVAGRLYLSDRSNHQIWRIDGTNSGATLTRTLVAGTGQAGYADGPGNAAQFNYPTGLALDADGILYVADTGNHLIRRITPDGTVSTVAGAASVHGHTDGRGTNATFWGPRGVAVNSEGKIYVADTGNNLIRKITPSGFVSTLAGQPSANYSGWMGRDGVGTAARFTDLKSLAIDAAGNIYASEPSARIIRRITPQAEVSVFAGSPARAGSSDGFRINALFAEPRGVAISTTGNIYICDTGNSNVRKIDPSGNITSIPAPAAMSAIAADPAENLLVGGLGFWGYKLSQNGAYSPYSYGYAALISDGLGGVIGSREWAIYKTSPDGRDTWICGTNRSGYSIWGSYKIPGYLDGPADQAMFNEPRGLARDAAGNLYIADRGNHAIRKVAPDGSVSTIAGVGGSAGYLNARGMNACFNEPTDIVLDRGGNLFVADSGNQAIRKITPSGDVTTFAGEPGPDLPSLEGSGAARHFWAPYGCARDAAGNVYFSDSALHCVEKLTLGGTVTILAGHPGRPGYADARGEDALFNHPLGVAVDNSGTVYVADNGNYLIRKIASDGTVTTLAGGTTPIFDQYYDPAFADPDVIWYRDGTGKDALFQQPTGVAVDAAGNVFVADSGNHMIRKITPAGQVSTVSGAAYLAWPRLDGANWRNYLPGSLSDKDVTYTDGGPSDALFFWPLAVAVDSAGNLFVADTGNCMIRKIAPDGNVSTVAGAPPKFNHGDDRWHPQTGSADGKGAAAKFNYPEALAVDGNGNIYLSDTRNHLIRKISSDGMTATIGGMPGISGLKDGPVQSTQLSSPAGIAADPSGAFYFIDFGNRVIRKGVPFEITRQPAGAVVTPGSDLTLQLGTSSAVPVTYQWRKGTDASIPGANGLFLSLKNLQFSDAGLYNVLAFVGDDVFLSDPAPVAVLGNPAVISDPAPPTLPAYDDAVFRVEATGGGLSYQWLKNGNPVPGATNATFTIVNAKAADAGAYSVRISNLLGTATSKGATLTVNQLPPYLTAPFNETVLEAGRLAALSVSASGTPPLIYQWFKNGVLIPGANQFNFLMNPCLPRDAGNYSVIVSNDFGQIAASAALIIKTPYQFIPIAGEESGSGLDLYAPQAVAADASGNICVADNNRIVRLNSYGIADVLAGSAGAIGAADGPARAARFDLPTGLATSRDGSIYVVDQNNQTIQRIHDGLVETIAGAALTAGFHNAAGTDALFNGPRSIAVDREGTIFAADASNHSIRVISTSGDVGTIAGTGNPGQADGPGREAEFNIPNGIAISSNGDIFVADSGNHAIRKLTRSSPASQWTVSTIAGKIGVAGFADGRGASARFSEPMGLAAGPNGEVFVADMGNGAVRQITAEGLVFTLKQGLITPVSVASSLEGSIYVVDMDQRALFRGVPAIGLAIDAIPKYESVLAGMPSSMEVRAGGTTDLHYQWQKASTNLPRATNNTLAFPLTTTNAAGRYTVTLSNALGGSVSFGVVLSVAMPYTFSLVAGSPGEFGTANGASNTARFNLPFGLAVNGAGEVFVSDQNNSTIRKISLDGIVTALAGSPGLEGSGDGPGNSARFNKPAGLALDPSGNLIVADMGNHIIRKITPQGVVTTLAGAAGQNAADDGPARDARFDSPVGVAAGPDGRIYVADTGNNLIRVIDSNGAVSTLAGSAGLGGADDGLGSQASFNVPEGIAADQAGNIFVADGSSSVIRKITPEGLVTTIAGGKAAGAAIDGPGIQARYSHPRGISLGADGTIFLTDSDTHLIRVINTLGQTQTIGGSPDAPEYAEGTGAAALFNVPIGIATGPHGEIYIADGLNQVIRKGVPLAGAQIVSQPRAAIAVEGYSAAFDVEIAATGAVAFQWFKGAQAIPGANNRSLQLATVSQGDAGLYSVALENGGGSSRSAEAQLSILPPYQFMTLAGAPTQPGSDDGAGAAARFWFPSGLAMDADTNLFVADTDNQTLRLVTSAGVVTTLFQNPDVGPQVRGRLINPPLNNPTGVAFDRAGNLFIADSFNHAIRKVLPDGTSVLFVGGTLAPGSVDGPGDQARFRQPFALAVDSSGTVFVADTGNHIIRKITPAGVVSTLAGFPGAAGSQDGRAGAARFRTPRGIAMGADGFLYVADSGNHIIRQISTNGEVRTIAGFAGRSGWLDGNSSDALFNNPQGIAIDLTGNIFVADRKNHVIREITRTWDVLTVAGWAGSAGTSDGIGAAVRFYEPCGVALDSVGNLYVSDDQNHTIRKGWKFSGILLQEQPPSQPVAHGSTASLKAQAIGQGPLTYQWMLNGVPLAGATNAEFTVQSATRTNSGIYSVAVSSPGGTVVSTNAAVRVVVPPQIKRPILLPDGTLRLIIQDSDGKLPYDLSKVEVQWRSSLSDNEWQPLDTPVRLVDGALHFLDPAAAKQSTRFYRVIER